MSTMRVTLPVFGEGFSDVTLQRWLVGPGDAVELEQPLLEVSADKVDAEFPSPVAGVVRAILVPEGATVAPGVEICIIEEAVSEDASQVGERGGTAAARGGAESGGGEPNGFSESSGSGASGASRGSVDSGDRAAVPAQRPAPANTGAVPAEGQDPQVVRPVASPVASDAAFQPASGMRSTGGAGGLAVGFEPSTTTEPLTPMRRIIAERLGRSWREAPHAWMLMECDLTELVALRTAERAAFARREGFSLTYLPFFVQAVAVGLRAQPLLNASWSDAGIVRHGQIDLGIAVALEGGLVVPVLREADGQGIAALARRLHALVERARSGRLLTEELRSGTFTVNNIGALGSIASAPIINPPHAGIATLEAIVPKPAALGGEVAIRQLANVCLSYDHRIADGLVAARFLQVLRTVLEGYRPGDTLD